MLNFTAVQTQQIANEDSMCSEDTERLGSDTVNQCCEAPDKELTNTTQNDMHCSDSGIMKLCYKQERILIYNGKFLLLNFR